jgi:hypothetical protein
MKRNHFLALSAVLAWIFSITMMLAPDKMLGGLGVAVADSTNWILQLVGVNLFAIGCINFLARNDEGSKALKGVMIGNIILHVVGFAFDFYGFGKGLSAVSSVIMGGVVHIGMVSGFFYYLINVSKQQ